MASPFTDSKSGAVVSPTAFYQASRRLSSSGEYPAVCMTKEFVIAISAGYVRSGTLYYMVGKVDGKKLEWHDEKKILLDGHCSFPSVAATSEGMIFLAYVKNQQFHYIFGKKVGNQVEWSHPTEIEELEGIKNVSVSLHIGDDDTITFVLAYVSSSDSGCHGYTWIGILQPGVQEKNILWNRGKQKICSASNFKEVSIAISPSKDVIVAYRVGYMKICCQVGKLTTTTDHAFSDEYGIEFYSGPGISNLHGFYPSVTINKHGHVMLMYQSTTLRKVMCHTGIVQSEGLSGRIEWKDNSVADHVDYGCYPAVTLADTGDFIELHGTNFGTSLFYRVGKLE